VQCRESGAAEGGGGGILRIPPRRQRGGNGRATLPGRRYDARTPVQVTDGDFHPAPILNHAEVPGERRSLDSKRLGKVAYRRRAAFHQRNQDRKLGASDAVHPEPPIKRARDGAAGPARSKAQARAASEQVRFRVPLHNLYVHIFCAVSFTRATGERERELTVARVNPPV
jgi:hypothetical protein